MLPMPAGRCRAGRFRGRPAERERGKELSDSAMDMLASRPEARRSITRMICRESSARSSDTAPISTPYRIRRAIRRWMASSERSKSRLVTENITRCRIAVGTYARDEDLPGAAQAVQAAGGAASFQRPDDGSIRSSPSWNSECPSRNRFFTRRRSSTPRVPSEGR